jgi:hypothetical protein
MQSSVASLRNGGSFRRSSSSSIATTTTTTERRSMSSASSSTDDDNDDVVDDDDDDGAAYYDNSKRPRSGPWFFGGDHNIRYPGEVLSSMCHRDVTPIMVRDIAIAIFCFQFGIRGPAMFVLPLVMGGSMTMRPIPYQVTRAGDVLLDLTLSNEYVPKSDVTFPCESPFYIYYTTSSNIILLWLFRSFSILCRAMLVPPRHLSVTPVVLSKRGLIRPGSERIILSLLSRSLRAHIIPKNDERNKS